MGEQPIPLQRPAATFDLDPQPPEPVAPEPVLGSAMDAFAAFLWILTTITAVCAPAIVYAVWRFLL